MGGIYRFLFIFGLFGAWLQAEVKRPPQFVLIAYDNCKHLETWELVEDFLVSANASSRKPVNFTFFLSAAALVRDDVAKSYPNPAGNGYISPKGIGRSNIGWGGSKEDVAKRIEFINRLHRKGNEMASHAVGHFDGKNWPIDQWNHEFNAFSYIIDNTQKINGFSGNEGQLDFSSDDIRGFRAPYLAVNAPLYRLMSDPRSSHARNMDYDTSATGNNYSRHDNWPKPHVRKDQQNFPIWDLGLAFIPVNGMRSDSGGAVKTLSMDYNFFMRHSLAKEQPAMAKEFGASMLRSYAQYFIKNYNGNRAPIHLGHHFTPYQSGEYNKALLNFASAVCRLPEVNCVTYSQLSDYMSSLSEEERRSLQAGDFEKAPFLSVEDVFGDLGPERMLPRPVAQKTKGPGGYRSERQGPTLGSDHGQKPALIATPIEEVEEIEEQKPKKRGFWKFLNRRNR